MLDFIKFYKRFTDKKKAVKGNIEKNPTFSLYFHACQGGGRKRGEKITFKGHAHCFLFAKGGPRK